MNTVIIKLALLAPVIITALLYVFDKPWFNTEDYTLLVVCAVGALLMIPNWITPPAPAPRKPAPSPREQSMTLDPADDFALSHIWSQDEDMERWQREARKIWEENHGAGTVEEGARFMAILNTENPLLIKLN